MRAGAESEIIAAIRSHMPTNEGEAETIRGVNVDASDFVPPLSGY